MTPIRTVIVEDDLSTCLLMKEFLSGLSNVVLCGMAHDGQSGLELVEQIEPDLLLLDIVMPGLDGIGVLRALRSHPPKRRVRIIVLSGVSADETVQQALSLGADYYLLKPVDFSRLGEQIALRFQPPANDARLEGAARFYLESMEAPRCQGVDFVAAAAAVLAQQRDVLLKEAYYEVTRRYDSTYDRVEKNIRALISKLHQNSSGAYLALIGLRPRPPSNGDFLRALAQKLSGQRAAE